MAQYRSSPFSYNYLDANWVSTEIGEQQSGLDAMDGFGGRLSFDSPEGVRVLLNYQDTEADANVFGTSHTYKRTDLEAGVGFVSNPSDTTDLVLDLKYLRGEFTRPTSMTNTRKTTQHGYGVEFGLRTLMHEMVEFGLSGEFREYFVSEFGGHAGLQFMFGENFGISLRYNYFETQQTMTAGIRIAM
ncbi:MAG: hypothetical protein ACI8X5_004199 [Planctomycetota bacterium]|jgi:hypothetical protein